MALADYDLSDIDYVVAVYENLKKRPGVSLMDAAQLTLAVTCRSLDLSVNGLSYRMCGDDEDEPAPGEVEPFLTRKN